jgi:hypothetical protein
MSVDAVWQREMSDRFDRIMVGSDYTISVTFPVFRWGDNRVDADVSFTPRVKRNRI